MRPTIAGPAAALCTLVLVLTLGLSSTRRGGLLELTSLGLVLSYALLLVVAAAYALGQWPAFRWLALAPMTILLSGIPIVPRVRDVDRALTDHRFSRHFPILEATAAQLAVRAGNFIRLTPVDLPPNTGCCYGALVRRSPANELSGIFLVRPQLAYLYDPTGTAWTDGVSTKWRERHALGRNWYRLVR